MSEANPAIVRCASCDRILPEPASLPPEARKPCRWCGGMGRNFDVTLTAVVKAQTVGSVSVSDEPVGGVSVSDERVRAAADTAEAHQLEDAGFDVQWLELTPGGAWMVRVFNRQGDFIDGAAGDDLQDVLFEVFERLLPRSD